MVSPVHAQRSVLQYPESVCNSCPDVDVGFLASRGIHIVSIARTLQENFESNLVRHESSGFTTSDADGRGNLFVV